MAALRPRPAQMPASLFALLICLSGITDTLGAIAETASSDIVSGASNIETRFCEYYNDTVCSNPSNCTSREECKAHEPDKRNHCFVLWHTDNATGLNTIKLKGCFMDSKQCYDRAGCVEEASFPKKDLLFCCCEGDMCNANYTWTPVPTDAPPGNIAAQSSRLENVIFYVVILLICVISIVAAAIIIYHLKQKNINNFNELPTMEPSLSCPPSPEGLDDGKHLPIILKEVRAHGRFGAVWRAHLNQQEVAVKIFPAQDKQSWLSEQEIFKLPRMNHANILQYIGVDKRGDNLRAEYYLVTAYHEKGSLCDYLKANTITWEEACRIAFTMARGLMHLHDEVPATQGGARKPAVAHRDFKSKNVLLKRDMSACIADFGLALIFQPGKPCGDTHGQVGTRRYMAPEVLEGAINFTRDAFLRIDMYACGLVLWEIASRCTVWGTTGEYMLPLEEEVGAHPSLEEMQDAVVIKKLRPSIPESWREHNALCVLCDTMEECWDHDAEARLSASCVMERIGVLARLRHTPTSRAPLLIENAHPLPPHSNRSIE